MIFEFSILDLVQVHLLNSPRISREPVGDKIVLIAFQSWNAINMKIGPTDFWSYSDSVPALNQGC